MKISEKLTTILNFAYAVMLFAADHFELILML